jgi:proteasome lid subunit RPN8/RPN11
MIDSFSVTQRHYDIIIGQAAQNYPEEVGGFLGGDKEGLIQAIFPMFNKHLFNKTDTFAIVGEDLDRAYRFFDKHGLMYYGLYHSHPHGVPYPSTADINTKQKYHFIIGMKDVSSPVFNAFKIEGRNPIAVPLRIVSNKKFSAIDIHAKNKKGSDQKVYLSQRSMQEEADDLSGLMDNIKQNKPQYKKLDPRIGEQSDFSTSA